MGDDQSYFRPRHEGDLVLPCNSLFNNLIVQAHRPSPQIAIRDVNAGTENSYAELLSHAVHLRNHLRSRLSASTLQDLQDGKEVYIALLAAGGYEFAVGALAILAIGAAISPINPAQPVNEALYYVEKARSVAVLTARAAEGKGKQLSKKVNVTSEQSFVYVPIATILSCPLIDPATLHISAAGSTSPNKPALVIFTSGTTGPPKGGVLRLATITDTALAWAASKNLQYTDTLLHLLPVHHATGIWVSFFPFLLSGTCIEFHSGSFDPAWTWNRWRRGNVSHFSGVPTIYMRMMRHYHEHIAMLPDHEKSEYEQAARRLQLCMCGSSALPTPIENFWAVMLKKPIIQRYGSTELCVVFETPLSGGDTVPDGSIGKLTPGVDLKLVDDTGKVGDEGEVYARSPHMFSKYLNDPQATQDAHDQYGYYKSGDIARREGQFYFIIGRASIDIIKSGGYKVSALDVEREILGLPYVREVMVVGVPDDEFGQRVGAVVSLRADNVARKYCKDKGRLPDTLKLADLREDMRTRLAGYKLPTLLRVISGELPKGSTGKIVKKVLGPQYFPQCYTSDPEIQIWNSRKNEDSKL